jgi:hypothetical protein
MIITNENLFLIILGITWILGAVLQDLKRREVDNLWNFSLIGIALAYRMSVSIYNGEYWFFINGILGIGIFLFLANAFYYSRLFAGGDAKLLVALGSILPLSYNWAVNFKIFFAFILLFMVTGAVYSIIWSGFLIFVNWQKFSKEFSRQTKNYKKLFFFSFIAVILSSLLLFFIDYLALALIGAIILLFPLLFIFSKAVEESCMVKALEPGKVTEGDWLYEDIKVNGKKIKADWQGISKSELKSIQSGYRKKILIKQGIPFTPSFFFGFAGLIIVSLKSGLFA